jgi:hypothetical protein
MLEALVPMLIDRAGNHFPLIEVLGEGAADAQNSHLTKTPQAIYAPDWCRQHSDELAAGWTNCRNER